MPFNGRYILDDNGDPQPCEDLMTWARWVEEKDDQSRVAQTTLSDGSWVSTVFLKVDHNFDGEGPPVLFETMVFAPRVAGKEYREDLDQERYCTRAEALAGHQAAVAKWEARIAAQAEARS